jgi:two-component system cell cycle response regulator DivK
VLDGYGVLTHLRADPVLSNLPVIALTAFSRTHDRNDALVAGFDGYLSKPIDPEAFVAQIEKYLPPQLRTGGTLRPP